MSETKRIAPDQLTTYPFRNAQEFQAALLAYVDGQVNNPSRRAYRVFREKVWDSPVKDQWLPVIPLEELTASQRGAIDERIAVWDGKIAAIFWRWVVLGVLGMVVIAVIGAVLFIRARKNRVQQSA